MPNILDGLIGQFSSLAEINAPSGEERAVADYLIKFAETHSIDISEDDAGTFGDSDAGNITMQINGGGKTAFFTHMDTARPTSNLVIQHLADRLTSDGKTVLGVDNRAGIAILLQALKSITGDVNNSSAFTVVFTIREESSLAGAIHLNVPDTILRGYAFDSSHRPGTYIYKAPGAIRFEIQVNGRPAHSGISPEKGVNALLIATKAMHALPLGRIDKQSTMNIGPFHSNTAPNVVPSRVNLIGEIRTFNKTRMDEIENLVKKHFSAACRAYDGTFEYQSEWEFYPYTITSDSEERRILEQALINVGCEPNPVASFGGSDANVLNAKLIPTINLGIGAQNPHSNDEFILYEDLLKGHEIALELMNNE